MSRFTPRRRSPLTMRTFATKEALYAALAQFGKLGFEVGCTVSERRGFSGTMYGPGGTRLCLIWKDERRPGEDAEPTAS